MKYEKGIWWMPWRMEAMKDVLGCEKPGLGAKNLLTPGCPNGKTHLLEVPVSEYIGYWGEPGELKHLSTRRKGNQPRLPE